MNQSGKRMLSLLLALVMCFGLVPGPALAAEPPAEAPAEYSVTLDSQVIYDAVKAGEKITLTPGEKDHHRFAGWEVVSGGIRVGEDHSFVMPAANVEVRTRYVPLYDLTLKDCTASVRGMPVT